MRNKHVYFGLILLIGIITIAPVCAIANVINIPGDFETIQAGINAADNGDTVLVDQGNYRENVSFVQKEIVLASYYLLNNDEEIIQNTIIEGFGNGSVITMENGNNSPALIGFRLESGAALNGGGIYCSETDAIFSHLTITDCQAESYGGGMYLVRCSPVVSSVVVDGNTAGDICGGVYVGGCDILFNDVDILNNNANAVGGMQIQDTEGSFENVIIYNNHADRDCGGLKYQSEDPPPDLNRIVVVGNESVGMGCGIYVTTSSRYHIVFNHLTLGNNRFLDFGNGREMHIRTSAYLEFKNSIFHTDNGNANIYSNHGSITLAFDYCDIQDSTESIVFSVGHEPRIEWGDGNIYANPLLQDDYFLSPQSPCINAGDPNGAPDSDGSITDIGAIPFVAWARLSGMVTDAESNESLEGALLFTTNGDSVITNEEGVWIIDPSHAGEIDLACQLEGYNDVLLRNIDLAINDDIELNIEMTHPELYVNVESVIINADVNSNTESILEIENGGNGELAWKSAVQNVLPQYPEIWSFTDLDISDEISSLQGGCFFLNGLHYVTVVGAGAFPRICSIDSEGEVVSSANLPRQMIGGTSWSDLATNGECFWSFAGEIIYCLDFAGNEISRIETQIQWINGLAWDPDREFLWMTGMDDAGNCSLQAYNVWGGLEIDNSVDSYFECNLAYWTNDPDGYSLYMLKKYGEFNDLHIVLEKMNPETMDYIVVREFNDGNYYMDLYITNDIELGCTTMQMVNIDGEQQFRLWQYDSYAYWLELEPTAGVLQPNSDDEIMLSFCTEQCGLDSTYEANLILFHNAFGGQCEIPIVLHVTDGNSITNASVENPFEFDISSPYPNPFNSTTTIGYSLPTAGNVSLAVYDLSGREMTRLVDGAQSAGTHEAVWTADGVSSGVYVVTLNAGGVMLREKVVLVK